MYFKCLSMIKIKLFIHVVSMHCNWVEVLKTKQILELSNKFDDEVGINEILKFVDKVIAFAITISLFKEIMRIKK